MIKIDKNTTNTVVVTLCDREILTASTKYYLFNFIDDDTQEDYYFIGNEIYGSCNYNQFEIIETSGSTNLTASTISLTTGFYKYKVYEQLSDTNLSLSGTSGVVLERGKVLCIGEQFPTKTYYSGDTDNTTFYTPSY